MPSFDIVSEVDRQEVDNALNQARKEVVARFDFKGSTAAVEASYLPLFSHLALVLAAGIFLPAPLVAWFQAVARLLG